MRFSLRILIGLAAIGAASLFWLSRPEPIEAASLPDHEPDTANGAMVFAAGGCASCHATPGSEDKRVLAGGLALKTPFGTFVAPNISSDPTAGIGAWTDAQFASAMLRGVAPDGRHYYPAFPYTSYARMKPDDVLDLHAYLKTLPASANVPSGHGLAFPFSVRRSLGFWKRLYLNSDPVLPPSDDPMIARGQGLVEGPGHCGECHTPRDVFGGPRLSAWLSGGPNPDGKGSIPNITPHSDGLAAWSADDIAYYLESGFTPEFDSAGGSMTDVIENISQLPPEDRAAIAAYLKSVPALPGG